MKHEDRTDAQAQRLGPLYYQEVPAEQRVRPEPIPKEAVTPPLPMAVVSREFGAKYWAGVYQNQKLMQCCKQEENSTGQFFKTNPDLPTFDLFIALCSECGRRQYRFMVGGGVPTK